jgi:divalent metal cation (Fe/Co/Zn/Cd) transporter
MGWGRLDKAAFGIIYGAIMVLAILLAQGSHPSPPLETAVVLLGSVLAITLAKAFAEFLGQALDARERMTRHSWRSAWHHSTPTLAVANVPTALFLAAWLGWIGPQTALVVSQLLCVALLVVLGARAGWVLDHRLAPTALGALFVGGIGVLLSVVKYVIH